MIRKKIVSSLLICAFIFSGIPSLVTKVSANVNIVNEATIKTTSNIDDAPLMVDGIKDSNDSRWVSDATKNHKIDLEWAEKQSIVNVRIWSGSATGAGNPIVDFELLYWDGTEWVSIEKVTGNAQDGFTGQYSDIKFSPVETNKLRIDITKGHPTYDDARVLELEVYNNETPDLSSVSTVADVNIDTSVTYQTILGWGGNTYTCYLPETVENDPNFLKSFFQDLKTTDVRTRTYWDKLEAENDDDDPNHFNWEAFKAGDKGDVHNEFLGLQILQEQGVKLHFATWRMPNFLIGKPAIFEQTEAYELTEDMEAEFIESLAGYFLYAFNEYGIKFDYVAVHNEPDYANCIKGITQKRYVKLTNMLKEKLEANGYFTKYCGAEAADGNLGGSRWTNTALFEDENNVFDVITYHSYARKKEALEQYYELAKVFDKPIFVTEFEDKAEAGEDRRRWGSAMRIAMAMYDVLAISHINMPLYFCYSFYDTSGGIKLYEHSTKTIFPPYDMLKHFYNYIPVGSVMVDSNVSSDTTKDVYSMAFKKPDGKLEIVLINNSNDNVKVNINGGNRNFSVLKSDDFNRLLEEGTITSTATTPAEYLLTSNSIVNLSQTNEVSLDEMINEMPNDGKIRILVDKQLLSTDQDPVIVNDRTLVPLRAIFEALGAEVNWDGATSTVTATRAGDEVVIKIGDTNAKVNGETKILDVPATLMNSRTLVPVRFVSESLGATVDWNDEKKIVIISTK